MKITSYYHFFLCGLSIAAPAYSNEIITALSTAKISTMIALDTTSGTLALHARKNSRDDLPVYDPATIHIHSILVYNNTGKIFLKKSHSWLTLFPPFSHKGLRIAYDKAPHNSTFLLCATAQDPVTKKIVVITIHDYITSDIIPPSYQRPASNLFDFRQRSPRLTQKSTIKNLAYFCLAGCTLAISIPFLKKLLQHRPPQSPPNNTHDHSCSGNFIKAYPQERFSQLMDSTARMHKALKKFPDYNAHVTHSHDSITRSLKTRKGAIMCASPVTPDHEQPLTQKEITILSERLETYLHKRHLPFTRAEGHYNNGGRIPNSYIIFDGNESEMISLAQTFWQYSLVLFSGPQAKLLNIRGPHKNKYWHASQWKHCLPESCDDGTVVTCHDDSLFKFSYVFDHTLHNYN